MKDPVSIWQLDDDWRRLSTKLFDVVHQTADRIARNEEYVDALSLLFYGISHEDATVTSNAVDLLLGIVHAAQPTKPKLNSVIVNVGNPVVSIGDPEDPSIA